MAAGSFEVSGSPHLLTGTIAADVYELGGVAPTNIIRIDEAWKVSIDWELIGSLKSMVCGTWCLHLHLESIGKGEELDLFEGNRELFKQFPVQMTGGEAPTSLVDITPDGKWLIISRDRSGEENPGLYLQDPKGGPLTLIQHKPKVQTTFFLVSDDSKSLYFRANDVKPSTPAAPPRW